MKIKISLFFGLSLVFCNAFSQPKLSNTKQAIIASVEKHEANLIKISNDIWTLAETAFDEHKSSEILSDYAEKQGFTIERGVAGMPTAFVATYGSGRPIISVLGEFDALPGLSQKALPTKNPITEGGSGHGCGHNIFGAGSLGAAIAIKELIENGTIKGTIKFMGTPSEEKYFGKYGWLMQGFGMM